MAIQEAMEEEYTKDTPSFGTKDLEEIQRSGTEAGLLGIYNFPGVVYALEIIIDLPIGFPINNIISLSL